MGLLVLMACTRTTIHGITPTSISWSDRPRETLQPAFRWEPVAGADVRYDLIILESLVPRYSPGVGKEVYFREGLQEPEHTLEVSLQPDREYYWSIRARRGEKVSEWSSFTVHSGWGWSASSLTYPFFRFRTPDK